MLKCINLLCCIVVSLSLVDIKVHAQSPTPSASPTPVFPEAAPGKVVLTLKQGFPCSLGQIFGNGRRFADFGASGARLDELFATYQVSAVEPVFRPNDQSAPITAESCNSQLISSWASAELSRARTKNPARVARGASSDVILAELSNLFHVYTLTFAAQGQESQFAYALQQLDFVQDADVNAVLRQQWSDTGDSATIMPLVTHLDTILAPDAWATSTGVGVTVAVIDTGVDRTHPDLKNQIWINPGEVPNNGIDDDSNGFVDDVNGYDFYSNDALPDDQGTFHGTAVAGVIASEKGNKIGTAGIAPGAKIQAVRVLNGNGGGDLSTAVKGISYACINGADIINLSLGVVSNLPFSALDGACKVAYSMGCVVVISGGNESTLLDGMSPHRSPYVFSVGATQGTLATESLGPTSNFGDLIDSLSQSTKIVATGRENKIWMYDDGETSLAAASVSAVAALVLAANPDLHPSSVYHTLRNSGDVLRTHNPIQRSDALSLGVGRINAQRAVSGVVQVITALEPDLRLRALTKKLSPFPIVGSVTAKHLRDYQLFSMSLSNTSAGWTPVCAASTVGIANGEICKWNLSALTTTGNYLLRLRVRTTDGKWAFETLPAFFDAENLVTRPLAVSSASESNAAISGNRVAWVKTEIASAADKIQVFDLLSNSIVKEIESTTASFALPSLNQNRLLFREKNGTTTRVGLFNFSTGATSYLPLAAPSSSIDALKLYGNWAYGVVNANTLAVSQVSDGALATLTSTLSSPTIFASDKGLFFVADKGKAYRWAPKSYTTTQPPVPVLIAGIPSNANVTAVLGSSDWIVYNVAATGTIPSTWNILNTATGVTKILHQAGNFNSLIRPYAKTINIGDMYGSRIVYSDGRSGNLDIFVYDILTGANFQLSLNSAEQRSPKIWGNTAVWEDRSARRTDPNFINTDIVSIDVGQLLPSPSPTLNPQY